MRFSLLPLTAMALAGEPGPPAVLESRCAACHSGLKPASGFDIRKAAASGLFNHAKLLARVEKGEMPPGKPLPAAEIAAIRDWIGKLPSERSHWAFLPPKPPSLPSRGGANPIDALLPSTRPLASKLKLVRRVSFDLTGLPPTLADVDAFLKDEAPEAYDRLIERLLASPRYGERWARHWLDAAGYADSEGGEAADLPRPNAWRYRDYVIRAMNRDLPYDQFLVEQLAGDELSEYYNHDRPPPSIVGQLEATGFLRMAVDGSQATHTRDLNADYLWKALFDTQQIIGSAVLGLSLHCARCHDHKYEPITQREYYRFQAFFTGAWRPDGPLLVTEDRAIVEATESEKKNAERVNKAQDAAIKALRDLRQARTAQFKARHPKGEDASEEDLKKAFPDYAPAIDALEKEIKAETAKRIHLPAIRAFYDVDAKPPATHILVRGDYTAKPGDAVEPGVPSILDDPQNPFHLPSPGTKTTGRRLALARWITRPDHPLTARVLVNRVWAHHFGQGLVPSLDNLGRSGEKPANQALLDLLATEFVRGGWRLKPLHRLILMSEAYRQERDPRRLEAEAYRDAVLAVSGSLDEAMFGPPVESEVRPSGEIVPKRDARRSVYLQVRRSAPQTLLNVFSAPVMEINCARRDTYNSASQALTLMNSDFIAAQADRFASAVRVQAPHASAAEHAFRLAFSRAPAPGERDRLATFLAKNSLVELCHALLAANEFLYID